MLTLQMIAQCQKLHAKSYMCTHAFMFIKLITNFKKLIFVLYIDMVFSYQNMLKDTFLLAKNRACIY